MKNRKLVMTIGAVAVAAITISASASGALLSPRAAGNQIKTVSTTYNDPNLVAVDQGLAAPPRYVSNQSTTVAGTSSGVATAAQCTKMTASPKAIQACMESGSMAGCKLVTVAK